MQLNIGTSMKTELSQIISPRMIQSMEILQLPVMALQERIEHELHENPVLEIREAGSTEEEGYSGEVADVTEVAEPTPEAVPTEAPEQELVIDAKSGEQDFERMESINEDWSDYFNEESRPSANYIAEAMDKKHDAMANMADRPQSLQDFLSDQLAYVDADETVLQLVRHLISHLDERGYLTTPLDDMRQSFERPVTMEQTEAAFQILRTLDPLGIGAVSVEDCLLLQVTPETPHADVVRAAAIRHHLEDIQTQSACPSIQKRTGLRPETGPFVKRSRSLNASTRAPGACLRRPISVQYVVPDIIVEKNDQGEFDIRLVDDWTPNIYIPRGHLEGSIGTKP